MVGTPAPRLGRTAMINCASGCGARNRSGIINEVPVTNAVYGMPQASTWNCGTITSVRSRDEMARVSGRAAPSACR